MKSLVVKITTTFRPVVPTLKESDTHLSAHSRKCKDQILQQTSFGFAATMNYSRYSVATPNVV